MDSKKDYHGNYKKRESVAKRIAINNYNLTHAMINNGGVYKYTSKLVSLHNEMYRLCKEADEMMKN